MITEANRVDYIIPTPCSGPSMTFGGRCLNCGYDPSKDKAAK